MLGQCFHRLWQSIARLFRHEEKPSNIPSKHISLPNAKFIPVIKALIDEGHTATFRIRGFSMRPFLEDVRDCAIIAPIAAADVRVGDVILAEVAPRHYVLHRVATRQGDQLVLRGDGNVRGTEACTVNDVVGRATGFLRGLHNHPCATNSFRWRVYSRLWPSSPFLRRCLLAFHRRIVVPLFIRRTVEKIKASSAQ